MNNHKVILISDLPGYGKVALNAQMPILSAMGFELFNLPTALISNTFNHGLYEILDTTEYMQNTIDVWDQLGFSFDAIGIGYVLSETQLTMIQTFIEDQQKKSDKHIFTALDPIMGDIGKLYKGMPVERVELMCKMAEHCDLITPNMTEACFMADYQAGAMSLTRADVHELAERLYEKTQAICVITSVVLSDSDEHVIVVHDGQSVTLVPYEVIPGRVAGTGDIFAALLTGRCVAGSPLIPSVERTAADMSYLIRRHEEEKDRYLGIPLEKYLAEMELLP